MGDINKLQPYVKYLALKLIEECKKKGLYIVITSTFRSLQEQAEIYAQGRTKPGGIISNAKPGYSMHNYGLAFDFVPLDKKGKADWNNLKAFDAVGKIGESIGLKWGGHFKGFTDRPHFQWAGQYTDTQIYKGKRPTDPVVEYRKTIGQFADNYKAEMNRLEASADPQKDMKIYVLTEAREEKIKKQKEGK